MAESEKFLENKKWRDFIRQNTLRNKNGDAVISRDDPWFYDDVWDKDYKEFVAYEENPETNSTTRSVVR